MVYLSVHICPLVAFPSHLHIVIVRRRCVPSRLLAGKNPGLEAFQDFLLGHSLVFRGIVRTEDSLVKGIVHWSLFAPNLLLRMENRTLPRLLLANAVRTQLQSHRFPVSHDSRV